MSKILVIGAAKSGEAVAKFLTNEGYDVFLTDSKLIDNKEELEASGIHVYDSGHPEFLKEVEYDFIVKNPGIPYHVPFVKYFNDKKVPIYNEIEVASRFVDWEYGAITGTNGKTTVTTLLGLFLKTLNSRNEAVGNIGLPLSEVVMKNKEEKNLKMAVEIAAFQLLGTKTFHPTVAVCLNLTPDHIDYFKELDLYYRAKMIIYQNMRNDDWFLLNIDDENVIKYAKDVKCKIITYSLSKGADLRLENDKIYLFDQVLFDRKDLKIVGMHNVQNAMVAACMAYKMGVPIENIREVIKNFKGVEHRIEYVDTVNGVHFYNDSKGTNPDSTIVALNAFEKPVLLLAGGYDKKTGFNQIIPYLDKVKMMYIYGATREELKTIYPNAQVFDTLDQALTKAYQDSENNDVILLSPMCASWDQYPNYEVRGEHFKELVKKL